MTYCWYIWLHLWAQDHGRMKNQLFTICRWSYPAFPSCYAKKWQMRINIKKTKAIIFNKSGKIFRSEFKLGNQPIQVTDSCVYLGITFTPSGSFLLAQKKLHNKATRSLYSFLSVEVNIYNGASVSTVLKLFDSLFWAQSFCTTVKFGVVFKISRE